jgi:hypothetical protein
VDGVDTDTHLPARHRESIPDFQSPVFGVLIDPVNRELEEVGYLVERLAIVSGFLSSLPATPVRRSCAFSRTSSSLYSDAGPSDFHRSLPVTVKR